MTGQFVSIPFFLLCVLCSFLSGEVFENGKGGRSQRALKNWRPANVSLCPERHLPPVTLSAELRVHTSPAKLTQNRVTWVKKFTEESVKPYLDHI